MAITTDCAEGRHEVCRGAGPNHHCPQTAHLGDQKCACRCHEAARSPQDEDHEELIRNLLVAWINRWEPGENQDLIDLAEEVLK
jgi:hypothetical protein